jgi:spermidine synthase
MTRKLPIAKNKPPVRFYSILFLTTFSVFIYEILILRVLPLLFSFDLLFIIISSAMLGLGLGGIFVYLKGWTYESFPAAIPILFVLSYPVCTLVIINWFSSVYLTVLLAMIPFFLAGMVLAVLYRSRPDSASRLYFWDLAGGAAGCLFSLALVHWIGVLPSLFSIGILASALPILLIHNTARFYVPLVFCGFIFLWCGFLQPLEVGPETIKKTDTPLGKMLNEAKARWLGSSWDLYSRCDLVVSDTMDRNRSIFINGGTQAVMLRDSGGDEAPFFPDDLVSFPYIFGKNKRVLILGSGGGRDVLIARMMGAKSIRAVEINQGVIDMVESFKDYTGDIYGRKGVELVVEDGRSFIMRDSGQYDRIVLSLASTFAFSDLSSIAQMENYLFTLEAFEEYFSHLADDGELTIFVDFPQITEKFIMTYLEYSRRKGIPPTRAMTYIAGIAVERWSAYAYCLMIRKKPFSAEEADILNFQIEERGLKPVFLPHFSSNTDLYHIADGMMTPQGYMDKSKKHLLPTTDDNPFFMEVLLNHRHKLYQMAGFIGAFLVLLIGLATWRQRHNNQGGFFPLYFTLIGCAFMMVEVALAKRFSFYLGIPQLNLAVIISSILLGCGCGAAFSHRIGDPKKLASICTILGITVIIFSLGVGPFIRYTIDHPVGIRAILVVIYLFPVCFFLGMPFPLGLRLVKGTGEIPWLWGINGVASVLGSVLAVILAMVWGFNWVFFTAGIGYLSLALWAGFLPWE